VNVEFQKLCVRRVTVVAASGDCGVADDCNAKSCSGFQVDFPCSSPYVTCVGGTQVSDQEIAASTATGAYFTTGGGFSSSLARPDWQSGAVQRYLASGVTLSAASKYNPSGRAVPDLALSGSSGGFDEFVSGTSDSTPSIAAVLMVANGE
jgi:subtilase family serine protease